MTEVILFLENTARIIKVEERSLSEYKNMPNVLINAIKPKGIPPHYWKKNGNEIGILSDKEKKERDKVLIKDMYLPLKTINKKELIIWSICSSLITAIVMGLIQWLM